MKLAMPAAPSANCAVQWCTIKDHDDHGVHGTHSAPIEIFDHTARRPTVAFVDIEQDLDGSATRIVVHGPTMDLSCTLANAPGIASALLAVAEVEQGREGEKRIAQAILARLAQIESAR